MNCGGGWVVSVGILRMYRRTQKRAENGSKIRPFRIFLIDIHVT
jgi:hypothetical protein